MLKLGEFEDFLIYNETEFLGEFSCRAARFVLDSAKKPVKIVVLTHEDEIREFEYIGYE